MNDIKYRQFHPGRDVNGFELPPRFHYWGYIYPEYPDSFISPISSTNAKSSQKYIGLKDKNGVEIYEGDLIRYHYFSNSVIATVTYENGAFVLKGFVDVYGKNALFNDVELDKLTVIGNIYENPELLEKKS